MELRTLRSLVLLSDHLHFGTAARLLHVTQPALSKQIRGLEEEFGGRLFERGRRQTRCTALGTQVVSDARQVLSSAETLLNNIRRMATGETGHLSIGFGFHTFELVPQLVAELRAGWAGCEICLRDMSTAEQLRELEAGSLDIGFIRLPAANRDFSHLLVGEDRLALAMPRRKKVPGRRLRLADYQREPFVMLSADRSPTFRAHALRVCLKHGFHPVIVQETIEIPTLLALVRAGVGVGLVPFSVCRNRVDVAGVQLSALPDREALWQVGAVWRRRNFNPMLGRFLSLVQGRVQPAGVRSPPKTSRGQRTARLEDLA